MKDYPFSIAAGRTKFHRFLRLTMMVITFAIDGVLITILKHKLPDLFGVDIYEPIKNMEQKWVPLILIVLIGVIFVLLLYLSLRVCDWVCKQLRI
ncbi:hypothetical protein [Photobacterium atrarenae]|uniref:Uncharacterized protein n=1 Tax=Photobacterium atrarenae TaxID=865757 RepID=A0ABY5GFX4_9GAMM|nr:hypothetical protein [Photobacterium atrarenae]UTV27731.1 hypothetical protein NNL38_15875 [Photobacterium atrarenae]